MSDCGSVGAFFQSQLIVDYTLFYTINLFELLINPIYKGQKSNCKNTKRFPLVSEIKIFAENGGKMPTEKKLFLVCATDY